MYDYYNDIAQKQFLFENTQYKLFTGIIAILELNNIIFNYKTLVLKYIY